MNEGSRIVETSANWGNIAITLIEGGQPLSGVNECNRLLTTVMLWLLCSLA